MNFSVLVLGSGAATPTFSRSCSGQIVNIGGVRMLLDCGESTQNQLRQCHQKLQATHTIYISHLHGDHFFGLPGLLSTMHLCGRTEPVTLFAPSGVRNALELLFDVSGTHIQYDLQINELDCDAPTQIFDHKNFTVTAFPLRHTVPTYGYLFEEKPPLLNLRRDVREKYQLANDDCVRIKEGSDLTLADGTVIPNAELTLPKRLPRRYAYCCDTAYDESLVPVVAGADLLCMESTFDDAFSAMAEERQHCTASQAATIASKAGVRQLLLTHFSARYKDIEPLKQEATAIFPNTICASDGLLCDVPYVCE